MPSSFLPLPMCLLIMPLTCDQFDKENSKKWQLWSYSSRLKVAKSVDVLKTNLSKQKLADSTKRSKITNFM